MKITHEYTKQSQQWIDIARELYTAMQWRKEWEATEAQLKAQLIELSEHQNSYGGGFKFEQIERKGNVDYDFICTLHITGYKDLDLDSFRKSSSTSWKLTQASTEVIDSFKKLIK